MNRRVLLLKLHLAVLLAGFTGLFGKVLPVNASVIVGARTLVAAVVLGITAILLRVDLRVRNRRDIFILIISGALLAAHWFTFFHSIQVSTVAIGLLGFSSYPLWVTLIEPVFFKEKWRAKDLFIALAAAAGLALVVPKFDIHQNLTLGLFWGIVTAIFCAAFTLVTRYCATGYPPLTVAFYQQIAAALFSLPAMIHTWSGGNPRTFLLLAVLGVVFTAGLQMLIIDCLRRIRAHTVSVVFAQEPVYGIVLAVVFLGEIPSFRTICGGTIVLAMVFWASLRHDAEPAL